MMTGDSDFLLKVGPRIGKLFKIPYDSAYSRAEREPRQILSRHAPHQVPSPAVPIKIDDPAPKVDKV
jgi:hypothetical protein